VLKPRVETQGFRIPDVTRLTKLVNSATKKVSSLSVSGSPLFESYLISRALIVHGLLALKLLVLKSDIDFLDRRLPIKPNHE